MFGVGRVKVNVWTVDAGWRVEAITSTSRVKESYNAVFSDIICQICGAVLPLVPLTAFFLLHSCVKRLRL